VKTMTKTIDRKAMLSTLWIFAVLNYVYADVFNLQFNPVLQKEVTQQLLAGRIGSIQITQGFVLVFAVIIETAIAMVLLSRILPYQANRWANIIIAVVQTASVAFSLFAAVPTLFYAFFATIEIATTLFIIWYAWTWRHPEAG
jgi:Family of unknown function (DUF6326)